MEEQLKEFAQEYYNLLTGDLSGINLTRILDFEDFYHKQIKDSIQPYLESKRFQKSIDKSAICADIGFGGGFPFLVLARFLEEKEFIGLEARRKKVEAVEYLAAQMNITNVEVFHQRVEMVLWDQPSCLTFKAVGKCEDFLKKISHSSDCHVYFYKGPSVFELEKVDKIKNWKLVEKKKIDVPGAERWLLGYEGTKKTNKIKDLARVSEMVYLE